MRRGILSTMPGVKSRWKAMERFVEAGRRLARRRPKWHTTVPIRVVDQGEYKISLRKGATLVWRVIVKGGASIELEVKFCGKSKVLRKRIRAPASLTREFGVFELPAVGDVIFHFDNSNAWFGYRDVEISCCEVPSDPLLAKERFSMLPRWAFDVHAAHEAGQTMREYWDSMHKQGVKIQKSLSRDLASSGDSDKPSASVGKLLEDKSFNVNNKIGHAVKVIRGQRLIWHMCVQSNSEILFSILFVRRKKTRRKKGNARGGEKGDDKAKTGKGGLNFAKTKATDTRTTVTEVIQPQVGCPSDDGYFDAKYSGSVVFVLDNSSSWIGSTPVKLELRNIILENHAEESKESVSGKTSVENGGTSQSSSCSASDEDMLFGNSSSSEADCGVSPAASLAMTSSMDSLISTPKIESKNKLHDLSRNSKASVAKKSIASVATSLTSDIVTPAIDAGALESTANISSGLEPKDAMTRKKQGGKTTKTHLVVWSDSAHPMALQEGQIISWRWREIWGHSVNFRLSFQGAQADLVQRTLMSIERCKSKRGRFVAPEQGSLSFEFDNSFSWLTEKQVLLVTTVFEVKHRLRNLSLFATLTDGVVRKNSASSAASMTRLNVTRDATFSARTVSAASSEFSFEIEEEFKDNKSETDVSGRKHSISPVEEKAFEHPNRAGENISTGPNFENSTSSSQIQSLNPPVCPPPEVTTKANESSAAIPGTTVYAQSIDRETIRTLCETIFQFGQELEKSSKESKELASAVKALRLQQEETQEFIASGLQSPHTSNPTRSAAAESLARAQELAHLRVEVKALQAHLGLIHKPALTRRYSSPGRERHASESYAISEDEDDDDDMLFGGSGESASEDGEIDSGVQTTDSNVFSIEDRSDASFTDREVNRGALDDTLKVSEVKKDTTKIPSKENQKGKQVERSTTNPEKAMSDAVDLWGEVEAAGYTLEEDADDDMLFGDQTEILDV
jgi:hypothetical protein